MFGKRFQAYRAEAQKFQRERPQVYRRLPLWQFYAPWRKSLGHAQTPLQDEAPWITFGARRFLEQILRSSDQVFEYGSGGSSIFFARRVARVVTVEHDAAFIAQVREALARLRLKNCDLRHIPPEPDAGWTQKDPAVPGDYISSAEQFRGQSFRAYATAIDALGEFDVVSVDGRARPACFRHAVRHVKPGGWIMLDNAERAIYRDAHDLMARAAWPLRDFYGPGPYNTYFWQTCLWQRPAHGPLPA
ncbi:MAG TPA: hypothetical protein VHB20_15805 [Verrucomicrobiae bacterium]|jgi:predicted O-methyltransferase YrrM|nr:hypothetical protein [Verrucomicrobiae bacterium]